MTATLDEVGLYVVDCNMSIYGQAQYDSLDALRKDVINHKTTIILDVDCFIGKNLWRQVETFHPSPLEIISLDITDVLKYFEDPEEPEDSGEEKDT